MINNLIIVRGAGDLATGTISKLHNCGFKVLALETDNPTTIRRHISFSSAVFEKTVSIEGIKGTLINSINELENLDGVGIMVDPSCDILKEVTPLAVVDAIIAKKNLGTNIDMSNIVIALGPGFNASVDCHAVIETKRGHSLGKIYYDGFAIKNTGVPGNINGFSKERVLHSLASGKIKVICDIGSIVKKGDTLALIDETPLIATMDGLVRGMIRDGMVVKKGLKIADIDPRCDQLKNCYTISDKARCIAGGVIEALLFLQKRGI